MTDIIIIGAGAAGLTAAIAAARHGAKVKILEHTNKAGKKILSTGNGKCNITNAFQDQTCYRGQEPSFAMEALKEFGVKDTLAFMESLGILCKEKNGYYYPRSEQAVTIREGLMMECARLGIDIQYEVNVTEIQRQQEKFLLYVNNAAKNNSDVNNPPACYICRDLIIATGSKAAPATGSDGSGYPLAQALGVKIVKPLPALVQLKCEESIYSQAAGVRCGAEVTIIIEGQEAARERGELQITKYGISGIVVMQLSRFAVKALDSRKEVMAVIDFFPDICQEELLQRLIDFTEKFSDRPLLDIMSGFMNRKLASSLLKELGVKSDRKGRTCHGAFLEDVAAGLKHFESCIIGFNGFLEAQVCQGGVSVNQVCAKTMEVKEVPGLYFAGEILDIDGTCGGYNLQFAWSSGYLAGKSAALHQRNLGI